MTSAVADCAGPPSAGARQARRRASTSGSRRSCPRARQVRAGTTGPAGSHDICVDASGAAGAAVWVRKHTAPVHGAASREPGSGSWRSRAGPAAAPDRYSAAAAASASPGNCTGHGQQAPTPALDTAGEFHVSARVFQSAACDTKRRAETYHGVWSTIRIKVSLEHLDVKESFSNYVRLHEVKFKIRPTQVFV